MKNYKHRKLLFLISSALFLLVGIIGLFFAFANKTTKEEQIIQTETHSDTYYDTLKSDSFDLNTTYSGFLKFSYDDANQKAKLEGFSDVTGASYAADLDAALLAGYHKFLTIPSTVTKTVGTQLVPYYVSEIDFDGLYDGSDPTSQTIAHYITGIAIPKSVEKISENAFAAFGSLEYFETPFIGTERGSSAWYLNNVPVSTTNQQIRESKPLVSMFDNPTAGFANGEFYGFNDDGTKKTCTYNNQPNLEYMPTKWYEKDDTSIAQYRMPVDLTKIVVTDEYSIGNHAIWWYTSLQHLEIYANAEYLESNFINIGESAFSDNPNLVDIKLPITANINLTNAVGMLRSNPELLEVRLPGTTYIPEACFAQCQKLKKVFLPSETKEISTMAFEECNDLENIYFYSVYTYQEGQSYSELASGTINFTTILETIGRAAFKNCKKFKVISLPDQLQSIGFETFMGCNSIERMTLPFIGGHKGECNSLCASTGEGYEYHNCFGYIFGVGSDTTLTYGAKELYATNKAITLGIPKTLETIRVTKETKIIYGALQNLKSVKYLYLPTTLDRIDVGSMNGMSSLFHLEIPFTNGHVGACFGTSQFLDNKAYSTIYVGKDSNNNSLYYWVPNSLEEIEITNQSWIGGSTFHNCESLVKVVIGNATQGIDSGAFFNNKNLYSLSVPFVGRQRGYFTNTYDHYYTWWWWRDIHIRDAFIWIFNTNSSNNTYWNTAQYYEYNKSWYCRYVPMSLKEVYITDDTSVSSLAFEYQSYIEKLSVTAGNIDEGAFKGMARLQELTVPYIGYNSNLYGYDGRSRTIGYVFGDYDNGHSYSYESHYGFNIPNTLAKVNITGTNPAIPNYAFQNCKSLITININGTIDRLGYAAFQNCYNLQSLNVPYATYQTVGDYAFANDAKLFDIARIIPVETVTAVGNYSFYGTSVGGSAYPIDYSKFKSIGQYAFGNCIEIQSVTLTAENSSIGKGAFSGCQSLTDVTLTGKVAPYMFENCYLLEKINFRDPVAITVIPDGIFKNCYNLKYASSNLYDGFVISQETTSIGAEAFYGCSSFDRFIIPVTCTSIGNKAFSRCTGLEYMTIPYETVKLGTQGWEDCDSNFYFYVYKPESQWPSTWPNNWNCGYPVYIIGDIEDNSFTYEYDPDHKGYFITGVEDGVVLKGQIKLPARHNGLNVYGVTNTSSTNQLWKQTGITSIIVPKTMYYLASSFYSQVQKGAFQTGNRIDVYFEAKKADIANYLNTQQKMEAAGTARGAYGRGWQIGDTTYDEDLGLASDFEKGLISYGLIFYGDSWEYINITSKSTAPAIKASTLYFDFKFSNKEYTSYQIKADSLAEIIYGTAICVDNNDLDNWVGTIAPDMFDTGDDFTEMFTSAYSNNVNAGTATITSNLRTGLYNDYISRLGDYPLYITGTNRYNYTISKARIYLYSQDSLKFKNISDAVYSGSEWSNNQWDNTNVLGLNDFGATFSGRLNTKSANVGTYSATADGGLGNFYWASDYRVMRGSANLTDNFEVFLYLTVKINPQRVTIGWVDDTPTVDTTYLEYRYNGSTIVTPRAVAKRVDYVYASINDTSLTEAEKTTYTNITVTNCLIQVKNDDNYGAAHKPGEDLYTGFAYIDPSCANNYLLVYPEDSANIGQVVPTNSYVPQSDPTKSYTALSRQFRIIKGQVTITINLTNNEELNKYNAYKIPTDADYWSITFNETNVNNSYVKGLGTDTIFLATFRTKELDETNKENYRIDPVTGDKIILGDKLKTYNYDNGDIVTVESIIQVENANGILVDYGMAADYHFYRIGDDYQPIYEDDCYEPIVVTDFRVQIVYDEFEVEYYIVEVDEFGNVMPGATPVQVYPQPIEEEYEENGVKKLRTVGNLTYPVDGYYYLMYASVVDYDKISDFSMHYFFEGTGNEDKGLYFREADLNIFFGANVMGRHYNSRQIPLRLKTIKSNVTFANNIDKEYDRKPYDLNQYITKKDMVSDSPAQVITIEYYDIEVMTTTWKNIPGRNFASFEEFIEATYIENNEVHYLREKYMRDSAPSEVGSYFAVVNATETAYFNALVNKVKEFKIIKRKIYIDVSGAGAAFTEGALGNKRKYNGTYQTFTPDTDSLALYGYLLGEETDGNGVVLVGKDIFSGVLRTRSGNPDVYSTATAGDFIWDTPWKVTNAFGEDVTDNYQVVLKGSFEITNLDYSIVENNIDCVYDGSTKYAYVTVSLDSYYDGGLSYTVYYSLSPIDTNKLGQYYIGVPPMFSTPTNGTITVYYYVEGPYYNSKSGTLTVKIDPKQIVYSDPASLHDGLMKYIIDFDNDYHEYVVDVTDPWYAIVYYSHDGTTWQTTPYMLKDVNKDNPFIVYYKIVAENYETVESGAIQFIITDESFGDLDPTKYNVQGDSVTYNGQKHSIIVNNDNVEPATVTYSTDGDTWTTTLPEYVDAGAYLIYVRFYVMGYKLLTTHATLNIKKRTFENLDIETKIGADSITFDGKYHSLEVFGPNFSSEEVEVTDQNDPQIKYNVTKYYYTDPQTGIKEEVTLSYSSNKFSIDAGYGFSSTKLEYKDANSKPYVIIIKVSNPNYEDYIVGDGETVGLLKIDVAPGIGTYTFAQIEYSKKEFDPTQLKIQTVHDGVRTYRYWAAYYDQNNNMCCDFDEKVADPRELGLYCFTVDFYGSKNVESFVMGASNNNDPSKLIFFEIVPKELEVKYLAEAYYTGKPYSPDPYVVTGTTDELIIDFTLIKTEINNVVDTNPDPDMDITEVGKYTFSIWIHGGNDNYKLDTNEIVMVIIKRQLNFTLEDSKVYDGTIYAKSNHPKYVYDKDDPLYDGYVYKDWNISSGLLPEHKLLMTLTTSRNAITTYTKTYGVNVLSSNRVNIIDFDIVLMAPKKDQNGNIIYEDGKPVYEYVLDNNGDYISVAYLYDISAEFIIKITKQIFDIESVGSETIKYDGYPHTLKVFNSQNYVGDLAFLAGADIVNIYYDEQGESHVISPASHTDADVYTYYVRVIKSGYETTFATLTLTIEQADLNVDIYDLDQVGLDYDIYDDMDKTTIYTVDNINPSVITIFDQNSETTNGSIRYYPVNDYSQAELVAFYKNFDENNPIFINSLKTIRDAGNYYCVVYYPESATQWKECIKIKTVTIQKRDIHINLYSTEKDLPTKEYDGTKIVIGLGGYVPGWGDSLRRYTFVTNDLVSGHSIDTSYAKQSTYSIRTISANADTYYGYNGFEFNKMEILDANGKNVADNYRPILSSNVCATITKAYLTPQTFKVNGTSKYYDTEEATPGVDTPSNGHIDYYYEIYSDFNAGLFETDPNNNSQTLKVAGLPRNAGIYRVTVSIADGQNYYGCTKVNPVTGQAIGPQSVDIFIYQATINVDWTNTIVTFNGDKQSAVATIEEADGNIVILGVYYFVDIKNNITDTGYVKAGTYQAYAEFADGLNGSLFDKTQYEKNYKLSGTNTTFTIKSVEYDLNIGNRKVKMPINTPWSDTFDTSMITGFPTGLLELQGSTSSTPQIRTKYSAPGTYSSSSLFDLNYKVILKSDPNDQTNDVTKSITFNVIGTVVIDSNDVPYEATDKEVVYQYGGYKFKQDLKALNISESIASQCTVTYKYYATASATTKTQISGNFAAITTDFVLTDVGIYEIEVEIVCSGYQTTYATITVEIKPKDAFVTFKKDLTKTYDGVAVSSAGLVSSTEKEYGFNGSYDDLIYTYYEYSDGIGNAYTELPNPPVDAGDYFILVTCKENKYNSNGLQNYTELSKSLNFQIKAKKIELQVNIEETLTVGQVGAAWSNTYFYTPGELKNKNNEEQLASYDYLYIQFDIANVYRTTYMADITLNNKKAPDNYSNYFDYKHLTTNVDVPHTYLLSSFVSKATKDTLTDAEKTWSAKWLIYRAEDINGVLTQCGDVTGNYDILLDFDAYFHLELIKGYEVQGVGEAAGLDVQAYTGLKYHGTVIIGTNPTPSVTQEYAINESYFDDPSHASDVYSEINNVNISYSLPGKKLVHYRFTKGDAYEPLIGSFYIDIQKIENPIYIDDVNEKIYDASTMFSDYLNIGAVTPTMKFVDYTGTTQIFDSTGQFSHKTAQNETIQDYIAMNKIKVQYKYGTTILSGDAKARPVNAGTYTCTIILPETDCFLEKVLEFEFTIAKRDIKTYDKDSNTPASMTYNTNYGVYNNLMSGTYYIFKYVNDDGTETELANTGLNFKITGNIVTSGTNVGTYRGSNKGTGSQYIKFNMDPIVEVNGDSSVSNNYAVNLDNATYVITPAEQDVIDMTPASYDYDGQYHTVVIQCITPAPITDQNGVVHAQNTIQCFDGTNWINLSDDTLHKFHFVDASTTSTGDKVIWRSVATNYEPYYGETYIKINSIPTTVDINTVLGKVYDGQEVLVPEDVTTNSTLTDSKDYTYTYYEWVEKVSGSGKYEWAILSQFKWNNGRYESIDPDLSVERPINVGKYMVEVIIPAISNYSQGIGKKEFEITGMEIDLVWGNDQLTYNGRAQEIRVDAPLVDVEKQNVNDIGKQLSVTVVPVKVGGDTYHKAIGSYKATADISTLSSNYIVNPATITKTFYINPQVVMVQLNQSLTYTGNPYLFSAYDQNLNPNGYIATGLCYDSVNGVNHKIYGDLKLTKTAVRAQAYKQFGSTKDFEWLNNIDADTCIILDENGNQVQSNYIINYNLNVNINFSKINISIEGSEGYEDVDGSNWTYVYTPGENRYITVTVLNSDAENYTVLYATTENGGYTQTPIKFTDVKNDDPNDPGFYTVYYRVFKNGDSGDYQLASTFVDNTAFYSITLETVDDNTFVPNKYYRKSSLTGKYELAQNYIATSDYYSIKEVQGITSGNFVPDVYYVSMDGYPPVSGMATITIVPRNAQLSFDNPLKDLSKTYDGKAILLDAHPASCEDETAEIEYNYYYYDSLGQDNKGALVTTAGGFKTTPINKGKYVLEVTIAGHSKNYKSTPIYHEFEIYERNIIVNVGPYDKVFDYYVWSKNITNDNIKMNDNGNMVAGIVNGQTFVGTLDTTNYTVGKYTDFSTSFKWNAASGDYANNKYKIVDAANNEVTENYTLSYNLSVSITKAPISVEVTCWTGTYDADDHSIEVTLVDSRRKDANDNWVLYKKPEVGNYVIYYSKDGVNYSTSNPKFRLTGTYPVFVRIVALDGNFNTLEFSNGSIGKDKDGNEIIYQSYVKIEGVNFEGGQLIYDKDFHYSGYAYPQPYYADSPSQGVQTVKFYPEENYQIYKAQYDLQSLNKELTDAEIEALRDQYLKPHEINPTDVKEAGKYHFILTIESDGIYDKEEFNASFTIYQKEIVISWKDIVTDEDQLVKEYTGSPLAPTAYFVRVDGVKVALSVEMEKDLSDNTAIASAYKVGKYQVTASLTDANDIKNYQLLEPTVAFTICKFMIDDLLLPTDLTTLFGDDVIIYDTSGNRILCDEDGNVVYKVPSTHVIFIDNDGNTCVGIDNNDGTYSDVTKIFNADGTLDNAITPYPYKIEIDEEKGVGEHHIKVLLNDVDNNMWRGQKDSEPLIYKYKIEAITIPDGNGRFKINIALDKSTMVINEDKPKPIVTIIDQDNNNSETVLVLGTDYEILYVDEDKWETDLAASAAGKITGTIEITGIGNYTINASKTFNIIDKAPDLLTIADNAPIQFIKVKYDEELETIYYQENENVLDPRSTTNYSAPDADGYEFFLGHIHQETLITNFLSLFSNNPDNIKFFTQKDFTTVSDDDPTKLKYQVQPEEYGDKYIGTGYWVVLYDSYGNIVDQIECIVYGDLDGNGLINAGDINIIKKYMIGNITVDLTQDYMSDSGTIKLTQLYAGIADRETNFSVNASTINAIKKYMMGEINSDFNDDYSLESEA